MNQQLQSVLAQRGVSPDALAGACEVDPKTVSRWLAGRLPHPRHRFRAAQHLQVSEAFLWPSPAPSAQTTATPVGLGLIGTYQNRASVPRDLWLALLLGARKQIEVLVFSGTFFAQSNPEVARMLANRAAEGATVRLCFGDPLGQAVALRGHEEAIGDTLAAKVRASLTYYRPLLSDAGCEVRLHDTTLYTSLFRYDDHLLVNPHVWGRPASANPVLHLRKTEESGWFDHYARSFEDVWAAARPWTPDPEVTPAHGQD
ncbi:XRE family transcriptional regulator [Streptomyces sp. NPDC091027]|uniref:XRE family transcriptional regulator n=1 Tax=Streptomyces sp. NPDC091027 TaxID=3365971 RepID=UPI00381FF7BC